MAFFDLPPDDDLSAEARLLLEEHRRLVGYGTVVPTWRVFGRLPRIIEARLKVFQALHFECGFSWEARNLAAMLIAHAKRCRLCFAYSRSALDKLGFDEATLDSICANPEALPLKEHDRLFVHYAVRIATASADLTPADFREMAEHGFSKEEVQEIIGLAAWWSMNVVFNQATAAGLAED